MGTSLISYSPGKRIGIVLFTATLIGIPLANWLIDGADFNRRFLSDTKWDLSIYFFGLAWLVYAATLPAIKSWRLVGGWRMEGGSIIAPDGLKRNLADFRGAVVEPHGCAIQQSG